MEVYCRKLLVNYPRSLNIIKLINYLLEWRYKLFALSGVLTFEQFIQGKLYVQNYFFLSIFLNLATSREKAQNCCAHLFSPLAFLIVTGMCSRITVVRNVWTVSIAFCCVPSVLVCTQST